MIRKYLCTCLLSCFSRVQLSVTLWTAAQQAPLSMGFSRQEYWSGLPCPPPEDLPDTGTEPASPALQVDSLPTEPPGKPSITRQPSTIRIYLLQTGNGFEVQSLCSQAKEVDSNYNVCFHSCVGGNVFFATNNYSDTTSFLQGKGELMIYCVIILSHHFLIWGIFALQYCVGFCCTR